MPVVDSRYAKVKRGIDLLLLLLVLPAALFLGLLCALAVALQSPGPVLFAQTRTGRDGTTFRMYKFRTMVRNAEELKRSLQHLSVLPFPDFKIINDPRVTPVGRFLRASSLDELPQLWNVLRGDMSFVGPRPTSFASTSYDLWHTCRLEVRPGLTGLWQIRGRGSTTFDERLRLDVEYIRTMSVWTDLKILVLTVGAVVRRAGT
jgi:lipopolysaccharide/colanic/teichoic acid biosynthesis glycosyltransferase